MPETRYVDVFDSQGNLVAREPYVISDEQLRKVALARDFNGIHVAALAALANWATLTLPQKDAILRNLLRYALYKEGYL